MNQDSLAETVRRMAAQASIDLDTAIADKLASYLELLAKWNARINLSSLDLAGYPARTIDRIILEPIAIKGFLDEVSVWVDLGSGGGSPAIPLKVVSPGAALTMVESRARKAAFLREAIRTLELGNATVEVSRIEEFSTMNVESVELVTIRAVRITPEIEASIAALLTRGGRLACFGTPVGSQSLHSLVTTETTVLELSSGPSTIRWYEKR